METNEQFESYVDDGGDEYYENDDYPPNQYNESKNQYDGQYQNSNQYQNYHNDGIYFYQNMNSK